MICAKAAEPIEMPFGMWTRVDPGKHVLDGMYICTAWQIRLNRSMWSFCQLLSPLVI